MAIFENSLFTNDDFLQISNILYTPREEEMIARRMFNLNTSYAPYAEEIGYDYYQREGSAKILAKGASAKDIPFVSEKGGRVTQKVYDIATGIRWTKAEQMAIAAKRALGKGPLVQLDTLRVQTARRYVLEKENELAFKGDADFGIKGLFDASFYGTGLGTKEDVAASGTGGTTAAKRLWANKTPAQILADIRTAIDTVETNGLFTAKVIALPKAKYNLLRQPYSTSTTLTVLDWIKSNLDLPVWFTSRNFAATTNGDTVDYMVIMDNDPEVCELVITEDINLRQPLYDLVGTMEQAVTERTASIILRHPAGVYIGKGI